MPLHDSPREIRALLQLRGLGILKKWGQNFLVNRSCRERIVALLEARSTDLLWEIGPGLGAMTDLVAGTVRRLVLFEIDPGYAAVLSERYAERSDIGIVKGDFVKTWERSAEACIPDLVLGNLPYNSASSIIGDFAVRIVGLGTAFSRRMVFTVQREMADRMTAEPDHKNYSSFSVLCRSAFFMTRHGDIDPGAFFPSPEVVSSVVRLEPRVDFRVRSAGIYLSLVRAAFVSRRKTIWNNLKGCPLFGGPDPERIRSALEASNIDLGVRAETLDERAFAALADACVSTVAS